MPKEWPRTNAVLTAAVKLPKDDRSRFIAAACPNEPKLRDELLSILDSYDTATRTCAPAWTGGTTFGALVPSLAPPVQKPNEPVLASDTTYGPYRVLRQLGAGGMGEVFLAQDVRLDRQVAIKSLAGRWLESPTARQRLMREARSAAALTHPHIATLYDVLEDAGHLLLVMEYVEGRPASELLEDGPIPLGHALRLSIQIADAVSYAHDRGIIHCDIKPANVQVALDGTAKVLDFGLARARYDRGDSDDVTISERGKLLGTLGYMAPERIVEGTLNASGDIYSLGVVIFELVTGRRFFDGKDLSAFLLTVLGSQVPKPSSAVSGVPAALDEVVERALAKKPMLRYQSARELSRDLQKVLAALESPASIGSIGTSGEMTALHSAKTRGWQDRLWAAPAASLSVAVVLTVAGFITSTVYNSPLGRREGFEGESALAWPVWGFETFAAPVVYMALVSVGFLLLMFVCRFAFTTIGPLRRWCHPVLSRAQGFSEWVQSTPTVVLSEALLLVQVVAVGLFVWRFQDVVIGLDSFFTQRPPGQLWALRPGNRDEHNLLGYTLSLQLLIFGSGWYWILKRRSVRRERYAMVVLLSGVAVMALSFIFFQVTPFRILYHNKAERVSYKSRLCYLVGQRADDRLLFCPTQPPPWRQIVRASDPALKREGIEESIFAGFDNPP